MINLRWFIIMTLVSLIDICFVDVLSEQKQDLIDLKIPPDTVYVVDSIFIHDSVEYCGDDLYYPDALTRAQADSVHKMLTQAGIE